MTDYEFWQQIKQVGQVTYDWWYPTIALPAFILAISVFLLTTFAARKFKKVHNRFLVLFIATIPIILTFPALYTTLELRPALSRVGIALPDKVIDFSNAQAVQIGASLNALALWGVIGLTITLPILWSGLLVTDVPVISPAIKRATKTITNIATRAFGNRGGGAGGRINAPYGTLTINRGQRKGSIEAVKPDALIGGRDADIQLNDPIVSRKHAKLLVQGQEISLLDLGSTNGTYIVRSAQGFMLDGLPIPLITGDMIYLGDPNQANSIEMLYTAQGV